MKTQRVTLLVSPADKRRFKSLADGRGVTVSEFIRQAIAAFGSNVDSIEDSRELGPLLREIRDELPGMRKSLRNAIASSNRALASIDARRVDARRGTR
jgi:hypothetical protein